MSRMGRERRQEIPAAQAGLRQCPILFTASSKNHWKSMPPTGRMEENPSLAEIIIMPTTPELAHTGEGHIFSREHVGHSLFLNPIADLGSLHEPEIVHETNDLLGLINHAPPTNLVIDLAGSNYLGTAMLGAIVKLWKRVCQRGGRLALCNVSENVAQVLHITKLHAIWPIYGTREQALSAVEQ